MSWPATLKMKLQYLKLMLFMLPCTLVVSLMKMFFGFKPMFLCLKLELPMLYLELKQSLLVFLFCDLTQHLVLLLCLVCIDILECAFIFSFCRRQRFDLGFDSRWFVTVWLDSWCQDGGRNTSRRTLIKYRKFIIVRNWQIGAPCFATLV